MSHIKPKTHPKKGTKKTSTLTVIPSTPKSRLSRIYHSLERRRRAFLARRPHRSFHLTRRRDYRRSLQLPGYVTFCQDVVMVLLRNWKLFSLLIIVYALLSGVFVGVASQQNYGILVNVLKQTGGQVFGGDWAGIGNASLLFFATISGSLNPSLNSAQQLSGGLIALLTWLTVVWLLRNRLAGHRVRLRDGVYSAGAPLISTLLVAVMLLVQLIPIALAAIGYGAAQSSGLIADGGVSAMLFWVAALLLAVLSLYWITSTLIALVVVTLPGMYPLEALRTAGDLVIGRRLRILMRFLVMGVALGLFWVVVMIPVILLDTWLKTVFSGLKNVPTIPLTLLLMGSLSIVWISSYVYLLYRKVVDDDAKPA